MPGDRLVLDDFIPYRLSVASNSVSGAIARTYEALFGLSIAEWRMVAVIAEAERGITQQAIGAATRMDKVTVSRAAIALVERGLLARRDNPVDRRSHLLELTGSGRRLYAAIAPEALAIERRLFGRFTADELAGFVAMLRRIEAAAHDPAGAERGDDRSENPLSALGKHD